MRRLSRSPENTPVVVSCCRTAVGRSDARHGVSERFVVMSWLLWLYPKRLQGEEFPPECIEDVLVGVTQQRAELGGNVARTIAMLAGLPFSAAACTTNRLCGSSLQGLSQACHSIMAGAEDVHVVAGVEHMHHLPMSSEIDFHPQAFSKSSRAVLSMGLTVEYLASSRSISRKSQEEYALEKSSPSNTSIRQGIV